jgi:hypothetical protein
MDSSIWREEIGTRNLPDEVGSCDAGGDMNIVVMDRRSQG